MYFIKKVTDNKARKHLAQTQMKKIKKKKQNKAMTKDQQQRHHQDESRGSITRPKLTTAGNAISSLVRAACLSCWLMSELFLFFLFCLMQRSVFFQSLTAGRA
jgi:hypothetical protein